MCEYLKAVVAVTTYILARRKHCSPAAASYYNWILYSMFVTATLASNLFGISDCFNATVDEAGKPGTFQRVSTNPLRR